MEKYATLIDTYFDRGYALSSYGTTNLFGGVYDVLFFSAVGKTPVIVLASDDTGRYSEYKATNFTGEIHNLR